MTDRTYGLFIEMCEYYPQPELSTYDPQHRGFLPPDALKSRNEMRFSRPLASGIKFLIGAEHELLSQKNVRLWEGGEKRFSQVLNNTYLSWADPPGFNHHPMIPTRLTIQLSTQ